MDRREAAEKIIHMVEQGASVQEVHAVLNTVHEGVWSDFLMFWLGFVLAIVVVTILTALYTRYIIKRTRKYAH